MVSTALFAGLLAAVGIERLIELRISKRNVAASLARGGVEHGAGHYPFMVAIHTGLLVGALAEVLLFERPFTAALGIPALVVAALCQGLRWWVIGTLGGQWSVKVVVVPGLSRVRRGPFRFLDHPNYVAVALEGLALPLVHGAYVTAALFTIANALLMVVRLRCENAALATLAEPKAETDGGGGAGGELALGA